MRAFLMSGAVNALDESVPDETLCLAEFVSDKRNGKPEGNIICVPESVPYE